MASKTLTLFLVRDSSAAPRMVRATTPLVALTHVLGERIQINAASPEDVAAHMEGGGMVETADEPQSKRGRKAGSGAEEPAALDRQA